MCNAHDVFFKQYAARDHMIYNDIHTRNKFFTYVKKQRNQWGWPDVQVDKFSTGPAKLYVFTHGWTPVSWHMSILYHDHPPADYTTVLHLF